MYIPEHLFKIFNYRISKRDLIHSDKVIFNLMTSESCILFRCALQVATLKPVSASVASEISAWVLDFCVWWFGHGTPAEIVCVMSNRCQCPECPATFVGSAFVLSRQLGNDFLISFIHMKC